MTENFTKIKPKIWQSKNYQLSVRWRLWFVLIECYEQRKSVNQWICSRVSGCFFFDLSGVCCQFSIEKKIILMMRIMILYGFTRSLLDNLEQLENSQFSRWMCSVMPSFLPLSVNKNESFFLSRNWNHWFFLSRWKSLMISTTKKRRWFFLPWREIH